MLASIPTWLLGVIVVGAVVGASLLGLLLTRPVLKRLSTRHNDLAGFIFAVVGVVYAVLLGLVAVSAWEEVDRAEQLVMLEAGAVADIVHHLAGYPAPFAARQQARLAAYARGVVEDEWPAMRRREVPVGLSPPLEALMRDMIAFSPATPGQAILHQATLTQLDALLDHRRGRLVVAGRGLKPIMWAVLWCGVALTIGFTYFFWAESLPIHMAMTAVTAGAIALVLFLILAMDHPLHGRFRLEPDAFERVLANVVGSTQGSQP